MLSTKPVASSSSGAIACAGMAAFQAQTTADNAAARTSVPQTVLPGPFSALAIPNRSMSALPITTGPM